MNFGEKLDFLMNITNTTNSALALSVSLDSSFISRLRRGVRVPAKKENYLKAMATYFARHCQAEYQKVALAGLLKIDHTNLPTDIEKTAELIYEWFLQKSRDEQKSVESLVDGLRQFKFKKPLPTDVPDSLNITEPGNVKNPVFYGTKGKQEAVIHFLSLVLKNKRPQTLLLYSDEDLDWLTLDPEFTVKWSVLLSQVIMGGNRIKIIHVINRSLDEMLHGIEKWLPIYMTGAIEPYYYPKSRDRVFRRTLFIAPDTAAVVSSSVGNKTKEAANFLFTDNKTIAALTQEYNDYLALCRPLMQIFTPFNNAGCLDTLAEFEEEEADSIIKTDSLSSITMPPSVVESIHQRLPKDQRDQILTYHQTRSKNFQQKLKNYNFTEIITMPDIQSIQRHKVKIGLSDLLIDTELFYTPEEFRRHLQNIIQLLQSYANFKVYLVPRVKTTGALIYVKEDVGILIAKTSSPPVVFAINESNMTAAFWDYMNLMLSKTAKKKQEKRQTICELEKIIDELNYE
jgi:hypothetical protein